MGFVVATLYPSHMGFAVSEVRLSGARGVHRGGKSMCDGYNLPIVLKSHRLDFAHENDPTPLLRAVAW